MKLGKALFARFGLFAPKSDAPDAFDLRLQRIRKRERRVQAHQFLFRGLPLPLEA